MKTQSFLLLQAHADHAILQNQNFLAFLASQQQQQQGAGAPPAASAASSHSHQQMHPLAFGTTLPTDSMSHAVSMSMPMSMSSVQRHSATAARVREQMVSAHIRAQVQREHQVEDGTWTDEQEHTFASSQAQFQASLDAEKVQHAVAPQLDLASLLQMPSAPMPVGALGGHSHTPMNTSMGMAFQPSFPVADPCAGAPSTAQPGVVGGGFLASSPAPAATSRPGATAPGQSIYMHDLIAQQAAAADAAGPDPSRELQVEYHSEGGEGGQWRPDPAAIHAQLEGARGVLLYVGEPLRGGDATTLPPTVSLRLNVGDMDRSRTEDCMASKVPVLVIVAFPESHDVRGTVMKHLRGSLQHSGRVPGVPAAEPALLGASATEIDAAAALSELLVGPYGVYQLDPRAYPHKDAYDPELPFPQYMLFHLVGRLHPNGPGAMKGITAPYTAAPQAAVVCTAGCNVVFTFEGHPAKSKLYRHGSGGVGGEKVGPRPKKQGASRAQRTAPQGGGRGISQATAPSKAPGGPDAGRMGLPTLLGVGQLGFAAGPPDPMGALGGGGMEDLAQADFTEDLKVAAWLARQSEDVFQGALRLFVSEPANKSKLQLACGLRVSEGRCGFADMLRWLFTSAFEVQAADDGFSGLLTHLVGDAIMHADSADQIAGKAEQDILVQTVQRGGDEKVLCQMVQSRHVVLQNFPLVWSALEQGIQSGSSAGVQKAKGQLFHAMMHIAATQVGFLERFVHFCVADPSASHFEFRERSDVVKLFVSHKAPVQRPQVVQLLKQPALRNNIVAQQLAAELEGGTGGGPIKASALHDDDEGGQSSDCESL